MRIGNLDDPFVTGTEESRRAAREDFRRQQRLHLARQSRWEELDAEELAFGRRHVEHRPTGRKFKVSHGLLDAIYSPVTAYVVTEDARDVVCLEELR